MIKSLIVLINNRIRLIIQKKAWRKKNFYNKTSIKNIFPFDKVEVGNWTYGTLYVKTYGNPSEKLIIGSFCSIAADVKFLLGGEHPYNVLSTYPFKKYVSNSKENTLTKGPIIINDDVWIGESCLILSGVTIGQGAIIAAGSIVSKDIPPYAIFAGGKIIKYRFNALTIEKLTRINFTNLNEEIIRENLNTLYSEVDGNIFQTELFNYLLKDDNEDCSM